MNLPIAVAVATLLHLLLLLGTEVLPGLRASWIAELPERPEHEPLRFTFVDLPQQPPEPRTPPENARASDRTRRVASQPAPEPVPPSPDPFSRGNTDQRVDARPSPEPSSQRLQRGEAARSGPEEPVGEASEARDSGPVLPQEMFPAPRGEAGEGSPARAEDRKLQGLEDALRPFSTRDLGQRFDNQAAPSLTEFGPISFDTVGVDWGPYARKLVEIIRARWLERIPQAAKMGLAGRSVVSFRIDLDGNVSDIVLGNSSGYRPLDKAAEFAIEAADLPPLPPEFVDLGNDDVGVTFEFYYNMRVPPR